MMRRLCLLALLFCGCRPTRPVERVEWPVMGTVAAVQWHVGNADARAAADVVRSVFAEVERGLNAHVPTSEVSRLAPLAEAEILKRCASLFRPCYQETFRLFHASSGAFNPRWKGAGTLDLGAIAKGFAVDVAAEELARRGLARDLLIDLGGNLRAVGTAWRVGVKSPDGEDLSDTFELAPGMSCATSAEYYRGKHIRDGRTGCVVSNGVRSVTVTCPSAMLADGLSTTLFVLGKEDGDAFLAAHHPDVKVLWRISSP